jgi:hypothetical protein
MLARRTFLRLYFHLSLSLSLSADNADAALSRCFAGNELFNEIINNNLPQEF